MSNSDNLVTVRHQREEQRAAAFEAMEKQNATVVDFSPEEQDLIGELVGSNLKKNNSETEEPPVENLDIDERAKPKEKITLYDEDGHYKLAIDPNNESALSAKEKLLSLGCDLSRLDTLGAVMNAEESARQIIDLKKPAPEVNLKDNEGNKVERDMEKSLVVSKSLLDRNSLEVAASGYFIRITPDYASRTGAKLEVLTEAGKVSVFASELTPGVNEIKTADGNNIIVNLQAFDQNRMILEFSQRNTDLKSMNSHISQLENTIPSTTKSESPIGELNETDREAYNINGNPVGNSRSNSTFEPSPRENIDGLY